MLYEQYRSKMSKVADVLGTVRKFRILIISVCLALLAITATLLGISGVVYDKDECPASITAGDELSYRTGAIFNSVKYEYSVSGSDVWTEEQPARPGDYLVRSVSADIAGKPRYGKVHAFAVLPRTVTVTADSASVVYGELPPVKAELLYSDEITCSAFTYSDYSAENTAVEPVASAITVYDKDGNDVTYTYDFQTQPSDIGFIKRDITISVTPYSADYDGKEHPEIPYTGYDVSSETPLAEGDTEEAFVRVFKTAAGEYTNEIYFKIYKQTESGKVEVTSNYNFNVSSGPLVINKRTLVITTSDLTVTYDGKMKSEEGFTLSESSQAALDAAGHTVSVISSISEKNADEYENILEFAVTDKDGNDVTSNYNFDCVYGTLKINPRPLTCTTDGAQWYYDGQTHSENTGFIIKIDETSNYADSDEIAYFIEGSETHVKDVKDSCKNTLKVGIKNTATGEDVTDNYSVNYIYGDITVLPRPIDVKVINAEWEYDGNPHSSSEHEITFDGELFETALVEGQTVQARGLKSLTDVAVRVPNAIDFGIYDGETVVTDNYAVNLVNGTLTVKPRKISVAAASRNKEYDGTPLTSGNNVTVVSETKLVEGHTVSAQTDGYIINIGKEFSQITDKDTVVIKDADGADVTGNYDIEISGQGTLTVTAREITITAGSADKVYDGTALTCDTYEVTSQTKVVENQSLTVTVLGSQTNFGESANTVDGVTVMWGTTDVTKNYKITSIDGSLTVKKRPVTIFTGSSEEGELTYNGKAQSIVDRFEEVPEDNPFTGILTGLGHNAYIKQKFERTDADTYDNAHTFGIKAGEGEATEETDVSDNYTITVLCGKLTINPRPVTFTTEGKTFTYNGKLQWHTGYSLTEGTLALETHHSVVIEYVAVKNVLKDGEQPVHNKLGIAVHDENGDVSKNYKITVNDEGILTVNPLPVSITSGSQSFEYNGNGQSYKDLQTVDGTALVGEHAYKYLTVPEFTDVRHDEDGNVLFTDEGNVAGYENEIEFTIVDENGDDMSHNYTVTYASGTVTITPRTMTLQTAGDTWTYDGDRHEKNLVKDVDGKLLDGSPYLHCFAVYGDELPGITEVGTVTNQFKVYILDADGEDISYNYEIEYEYGTLEVTALPVKVTARYAEKIYDATELSSLLKYGEGNDFIVEHNGKQAEFENIINLNYSFEAQTAGSVINVDDENNVTKIVDGSFKVYDGDGAEINPKNFEITYAESTLKIIPREIRVEAGSAEKIYNGTPLECKEVENCKVTSNHSPALDPAIVEGQTLSVVINSSYTDAGKWDNVIDSYTITGAEGEDVTRNYNVERANGTLTVKQRPITVYTKEAEKIYDGTALTCHRVKDITTTANDGFDPLVLTHRLQLSFTGEQTDVGTSDNTVNEELTSILDENGKPVTDNYSISYDYGTLEVKLREITVQTLSKTDFVYDGEAHYYLEFTITEGSLADDHNASGDEEKEYATVTDVNEGEKDNTFSIKITDADAKVITENYRIIYDNENCGKIKVNPRPIYVFAADSEKIYDGTNTVPDEIKQFGSSYKNDAAQSGLVSESHRIIADIVGYNGGSIGADVGEYNIQIDGDVVIKDGEKDISHNYTVEYQYPAGVVLTVIQREITVTTKDKEFEYNGDAQYFLEYYITVGTVVQGQTHKADEEKPYSTVTDVNEGEKDNKFEIAIFDGERNVTKNYAITYNENCGKLKVKPRKLIVSTGSDNKEYDGTPLTKTDGVTFDRLVKDHTATVTVDGSQTDVGDSKNTVDKTTLTVTTADGTDVTANYYVSDEGFGTLTVTKRVLIVTTGSAKKEYDGTPLTKNEADFEKLVEGHTATITVNGSRTDVGEGENTVDEATLTVTDSEGKDVTGNYQLVKDLGKLTVTPRPVTVQTGSATKTYDGKPLTFDNWEIIEGSLLGNHYAAVTVTGSQTAVGESANYFEIDIHDKTTGNSVLGNYEITKSEGTLKVTEATDTDDRVFVKVKSELGGELFLREESFGDYISGMDWTTAKQYGQTFEYNGVNYGYNYLSSLILQEAGYNFGRVDIELFYGGYLVPYFAALGSGEYTVQTSDTVYKRGEGELLYNLNYIPYDYLASGKPDATNPLAAQEEEYRKFVYENYLTVKDTTLEFLKDIIKENGLTKDNISGVAEYVKSIAEYDDKHDFSELESSEDVTITLLSGYGYAVCRHYATAATMLYRALGIPARYTRGFAVNTTAGQWASLSVGHAWVELYVDGFGWVAVDVTPPNPSGGGSGTDVVFDITLKPKDEVKKYDGTPLVAKELEFDNVLDSLCANGYRYEVEFQGSQTEIGSSASTVSSFTLYSPDGKVVRNVNYTKEEGVLKVVAEDVVTLYTSEIRKEYDGTPVYLESEDWYAEGLPEGYTMEVTGLESIGFAEAGSLTSVKFQSSVTVNIYNSEGTDVTEYFYIDYKPDFNISFKSVTVSTPDMSKEYDGTPLGDGKYEITFGGLVAGHTLKITGYATIVDTGEAVNKIGFIIVDENGIDVSGNYMVTLDFGKLTVTDGD